MLFLNKKVSVKEISYYCETIELETSKIVFFNTSECTKLLERLSLWTTIEWTLSQHYKQIETLAESDGSECLSTEKKKSDLISKCFFSWWQKWDFIQKKREIAHSRRWTLDLISGAEGRSFSHLIKNGYIMDVLNNLNNLMEIWQSTPS